MTRKDKISVLKRIAEGRLSVYDLKPKATLLVIKGGGEPNDFFVDGKLVSKEVYNIEFEKHPIKEIRVFIGDVEVDRD